MLPMPRRTRIRCCHRGCPLHRAPTFALNGRHDADGGRLMDDTLRAIAVWVHILGIAVFVGPQFFLAFAWGPVARTIGDQHTRLDLTRKVTRRFGMLAGFGLALIIV